MKVENIPSNLLTVSELNVRKTVESNNDELEESSITDLANDIKENGLLNPITVRQKGTSYEVIAGQRRLLACKQIEMKSIPCNVMSVGDQKAEELSLVENVQRNQMTCSDKVRAYSRLHEVYNKDVDKMVKAIHVTKTTLHKYIRIKDLPSEILEKLDGKGDTKISVDTAVELSKFDQSKHDLNKIVEMISGLPPAARMKSLIQYRNSGYEDINELREITQDVAAIANNMKLAPSYPYVIDGEKMIKIPEDMFSTIVDLIKKTKGNIEYVHND